MEKIVNDLLKEELYYEKLENGLEVYFMPKKGFTNFSQYNSSFNKSLTIFSMIMPPCYYLRSI